MKLDWSKLITTDRYCGETYHIDTDARSEFERDIDRVIFSSPFRRLKDKTQVFPVPKSDFVHNRLTHSIEVSSIGRSLGKLVGKFILENETIPKLDNSKTEITSSDFGHIVAAACLAHDIGNPPFGHSGEQSFRIFYKRYFDNNENNELSSKLNEFEKNDFLLFEGNAEGFRLLTNDHPSGKDGGLKLTYTTLGAFAKYPRESVVSKLNTIGRKIEKRRSLKKVGFFQKEKEIFRDVADKLGLISFSDDCYCWCRHPLSFLVEAADNISYTIMDLEDGHKLKLISTDDVVKLLKPIAKEIPNDPCPVDDLDNITNQDELVGAYRAKAINSLVYQCYNAFKKNYNDIMKAEFDKELTDTIELQNEFRLVSKRTNEFFSFDKVVEIESAGRHVISGLLYIYLDAYINRNEKYGKNLINNLPEQFKIDDSTPIYDVLLKISGFASRMTDNYAIDFYKKLIGNKLPEII